MTLGEEGQEVRGRERFREMPHHWLCRGTDSPESLRKGPALLTAWFWAVTPLLQVLTDRELTKGIT